MLHLGDLIVQLLLQANKRIDIVAGLPFIFSNIAAGPAGMGQHILTVFDVDVSNVHQPAAGGGPIARIHVHVFRCQAFRTMIGIPITLHVSAALLAHKRFCLAHKHILIRARLDSVQFEGAACALPDLPSITESAKLLLPLQYTRQPN